MFHVNIILVKYAINTTVKCNTNKNVTLASVQQVTEVDCRKKTRDIKCADASRAKPISFVAQVSEGKVYFLLK